MRTSLFAALALSLTAAACDCGGAGISGMGDAGHVGRCTKDSDCAARESCFVATGICFAKDACGPDKPCPMANQLCTTNADGFMECTFMRCADDSECQMIACPGDQVKACIQGGCQCGAPCQGGCPPSQGCCVPQNRCEDLPASCRDLTCPIGQFASVTSSGAWSTGDCRVVGEQCSCQELPPLPIGDIGLYSAIATGPMQPGAVMSAYDLDWGDLMYGKVNSNGTIDWQFVDGIGTGTVTITGNLRGPRGGNSAKGPDVGVYTDIAVDASGRPQIAYQDRTNHALRYAIAMTPAPTSSTSWRTHLVDGGYPGDTGLYASLALDGARLPRVAYLSARENALGTRRSALRLAFTSTPAPSSISDWMTRDIESLDLTTFGCADRCNLNEVCRASDQACVVPDAEPTMCGSSCMSTERCIQGHCATITALPPFRDLPLARGLWPSIQTTADGSVLVVYYDRVDRNLKLARIQGPNLGTGALSIKILDGQGAPSGTMDDVGLFPSLWVTPAGEIHLSYMNATRQSLVYQQLDPMTFASIALEEIENGLETSGGPDGILIGADSALVADESGVVRVAYQDATHGALRYARRMIGGGWTSITLAGAEMPYRGSFGFYTDQAIDPASSMPIVSTYRYFLSAPNGPMNGIEIFNPQ
jgi:hypothetical protein